MTDKWLEASSLDELIKNRNEMLACSLGTDIEHNDIIEEMPGTGHLPLERIESLWFDQCSQAFASLFKKRKDNCL